MAETPNPADFSINEIEGEYTAEVIIRGRITIKIKAQSPEEARAQADAEIEKIEKDGYAEVEDIDEIEISNVVKDRPMFRVTRGGKRMQVSHLQTGDVPRAPNERGF